MDTTDTPQVGTNLNLEISISSSEACLLSAMMHNRDEDLLRRIADKLAPADFESPIFAKIFTGMAELLTERRPCDPAAVRSYITAKGERDGLPADTLNTTIVGLLTLDAIDLHAGEYARQVASASYRRQFARMADGLRHAAETAPEAELLPIMVQYGIGQRKAWERYQGMEF